jgi:hypothetical protein
MVSKRFGMDKRRKHLLITKIYYNMYLYIIMTPSDPELYEKVKKYINEIYIKHSAYRSMAYIKEYKRRGGKFIDDDKPRNLTRWMNEKWKDVNPDATKSTYPVYRPTIRINKKTPLTSNEISISELKKQSVIKQNIKGVSNLKPFKKK